MFFTFKFIVTILLITSINCQTSHFDGTFYHDTDDYDGTFYHNDYSGNGNGAATGAGIGGIFGLGCCIAIIFITVRYFRNKNDNNNDTQPSITTDQIDVSDQYAMYNQQPLYQPELNSDNYYPQQIV